MTILAPHTYALGDTRTEVDYLVTLDVDQTMTLSDVAWARRFRAYCIAASPHREIPEDEVSTYWDHFRDICEPCFEDCNFSRKVLLDHDPDPAALRSISSLVAHGVDGRSVGFHALTARLPRVAADSLDWFHLRGLAPMLRAATFAEHKRPVAEGLGAFAHVDDSYAIYRAFREPRPSAVHQIVIAHPMNSGFDIPERVYGWAQVDARIRSLVRSASR